MCTRALRLLLAFLIVTVALPGAFATAQGESKEAQKPAVTLKVLMYNDEFWDQVAADFTSHHPNITIDRKKGGEIDTGATTALLQSGDAPDVMMVNSGPGRVGLLAKAGLLYDLEGAYKSRKWNDITISYVLKALKNFGYGYYEVVNSIDVFQVCYRVDYFKEFGLSVPRTWDEFMSLMKDAKQKIAASGRDLDVFLVGARNNYQGGWVMGNLFQSSAGYDFMTGVIYGKNAFNVPDMVRAATTLKGFLDSGYVSKNAVALNFEETGFEQGKGLMTVNTAGGVLQWIGDGSLKAEQVSTFVFPSMRGEKALPTAGLAQSWIIPKSSKNIDAALTFLDYINSVDYAKALVKIPGGFAYGVPVITIGQNIGMDPLLQADVTAIKAGAGYNPSVFLPGQVKSVYYASIQAILSGQKTPEEAMKDIQDAKDKYLASVQ
jgi:raffinose/stachyose/melibiose transport system substrate-binding protein